VRVLTVMFPPLMRMFLAWTLVADAATIPSAPRMGPSQETVMQDVVYTLGVWKVKAGHEAEFVAAWKELGGVFAALERPPGPGTLVQSLSDPALFYSFGPWRQLEDVQAMRSDPRAQAAIQRLISLCTVATPGTFRVVAEVPAGSPQPRGF
jgi:hypothetical protein